MAFQVMNIQTSIKDSKLDEFDTINLILNKAKKIDSVMGDAVLMSDGEVKKGYNPKLITRKGCFNISGEDTNRFYWKKGEDFFNSVPYFFHNKKIFLGLQMIDKKTSKPRCLSFAQTYHEPLLTINALYGKKGVKHIKGFFKPKENIDGKINFLEKFLYKQDKSGYFPKDMIANSKRLRLKILEKHYERNVDFYCS